MKWKNAQSLKTNPHKFFLKIQKHPRTQFRENPNNQLQNFLTFTENSRSHAQAHNNSSPNIETILTPHAKIHPPPPNTAKTAKNLTSQTVH